MNSPTKNQFWATLLASVATLALGILFTVNPVILTDICRYAGIGLCVIAAFLVIFYFVKKREVSILLIYGIIALIAGILLIILPGLLAFLIPVFFGAWLLISSVSGMIRNFSFRHDHKYWWVGLILCTLGAGLGAYVITRPMQTMETTVRIIGIVMMIVAVLRFVSAFMARNHYQAPANGDVIDITPNKD